MKVVVTGGAGFIGSHLAVELETAGHEVVVVDSLERSDPAVIGRIERVAGRPVSFRQVDVADADAMTEILEDGVDAVVHCAGLKSVEESVHEPVRYYETNLMSTVGVLRAMQRTSVNTLIFSSSATVYGTPSVLPVNEEALVGQGLANPYAQTKYIVELMLKDYAAVHPEAKLVSLRYFNPIGAHASGLLGESPSNTSSNLMPKLLEVAMGRRSRLKVFGNDYPTPDGTGVRDYVHVLDLVDGHVAALMNAHEGFRSYNLGTGDGTSVLQLLAAFERATGISIDAELCPRRVGDIAESYADPRRAETELGWKAFRSVEDACADAWRWAQSLDAPERKEGTIVGQEEA